MAAILEPPTAPPLVVAEVPRERAFHANCSHGGHPAHQPATEPPEAEVGILVVRDENESFEQ